MVPPLKYLQVDQEAPTPNCMDTFIGVDKIYIQYIFGYSLYYGHVVYKTILVALSDLATLHNELTKKTPPVFYTYCIIVKCICIPM